MRDAFARELYEIMAKDPDVLLLMGDIGYKVFDQIAENRPKQLFNMGVAEANMIGTCAGLALSGKKPFAYTIIPFLTMRAFEQIRVDIAIQKQPVKIVGVGGGLAYGNQGPTHHSLEDVAILRAVPNMTVIVPCDPIESKKATRAAYEYDGPVYIRLGRNGEPKLHPENYQFKIGKAVEMRPGKDATIVSSGPITKIALDAAEALAKKGIQARVLNIHTIKPFDTEAVVKAARETRVMVSVEEHNIIGGLGSAVSEALAESRAGIPFKRFGIRDNICYGVGSQDYHLRRNGVSIESISQTVAQLLDSR